MRISALLVMLAASLALAAPIADVPDALPAAYDLVWLHIVARVPGAPVCVDVEGYRLELDGKTAVWSRKGARLAAAPAALTPGWAHTLAVKRRPGTVAVLLDHRLLLAAPAPETGGTLAFARVPDGVTVADARVRDVAPPLLTDDFMRGSEERAKLYTADNPWIQDLTWKVARYAGLDAPGANRPTDPATAKPAANPWCLSAYAWAARDRVANGFWWCYRGTGPSWCVANDTAALSTWDRYAVQASVRTEYDGEVGLIAAYQDNRNYLLFRWKQAGAGPRAELVAVTDGAERVLAGSPRGFDPGQWYTLRLQVGWRRAQVLIDGAPLLDVANPGPIEGRVGLYASGAEHPRRPPIDPGDVPPNHTKPLTKAPQSPRSLIYFDDVVVSPWVAVDDLRDETYVTQATGRWTSEGETLVSQTLGRYLTGLPDQARYAVSTEIRLPAGVSGGLFLQMNAQGSGYLWLVDGASQSLVPIVRGAWQPPVATTTVGVPPGVSCALRAEVDGAYLALYCDDRCVMDWYDPSRAGGRAGLYAGGAGVRFRGAGIRPAEDRLQRPRLKDDGGWISRRLPAWGTFESEWYPARTDGPPPEDGYGPAMPFPTKTPGLYWHKGAHYHDLRVFVPVALETLNGQTLHLSREYLPDAGYRLMLERAGDVGRARLLRLETEVAAFTFTPTARYRLCVERRGSYLLLTGEAIDPEVTETVCVTARTPLGVYRDPVPLDAPMLGFTVTTKGAPSAGQVLVETDMVQDTFDAAPVGWMCQSGEWRVGQRYPCEERTAWYGGVGRATPTTWSKQRLDGDQVVEVYMRGGTPPDALYDDTPRFCRDFNLTICADGTYLNSGYTVIRATGSGDVLETMLLRKNEVIWRSRDVAHTRLPAATVGRVWLATRLEKHGGELRLYLDNRLAATYVDPDPLPGGYVACWTQDNAVCVGRVNMAAQRMTLGRPSADTIPATQEEPPVLAVPVVAVGGVAVPMATFEDGLGDWGPRREWRRTMITEPGRRRHEAWVLLPGAFAGQVSRVRDADRGTVAQVANPYPAGDLGTRIAGALDLAATPVLHLDYRLPGGAKINLYLGIDTPNQADPPRPTRTWYEVILTGREAADPGMIILGRVPARADGQWHHLTADLGRLLADGLRRATDAEPANLKVAEVILADWSTAPELRAHGFGAHPGGTTLAFDNATWLPRMAAETTITWSAPGDDARIWLWRADVTDDPNGTPTTERAETSMTVTPGPAPRYLHIQGKPMGGDWSAVVTVPVG